jgi:glycerol transport system ATP-binding protein
VSKSVGAAIHINDVSLSLRRGSLNVLLGPTLAGKTSLMRLMAGLDKPSSGRILFDGSDVTGLPVKRRSVAMVYQQFINYPALSVYENIASPLRVARRPRAEIDRRVREAAQLLKLVPYLDRLPLNLSGGQQQRTAIARALVKGADLVLMDEPLANLDYKLREELREELPKLFEAAGAIFVYATTEPSEALLLGGNMAALSEGRITQFGPTRLVYRQPQNLTTAQVVSDPPLNLAPLVKQGGKAEWANTSADLIPEQLTQLADGDYIAGFRPHRLTLDASGPNDIQLKAKVAVTEITGSESFIHADVGPYRFVSLLRGIRKIEPGTDIELYANPRRLFVFSREGALVFAPDASMSG